MNYLSPGVAVRQAHGPLRRLDCNMRCGLKVKEKPRKGAGAHSGTKKKRVLTRIRDRVVSRDSILDREQIRVQMTLEIPEDIASDLENRRAWAYRALLWRVSP